VASTNQSSAFVCVGSNSGSLVSPEHQEEVFSSIRTLDGCFVTAQNFSIPQEMFDRAVLALGSAQSCSELLEQWTLISNCAQSWHETSEGI
jgi:hypothetical protein